MAEPTNMLDALVSAINAEGGGASPTHVAPNTEVLVDSSQETPARGRLREKRRGRTARSE